MDRWHILSTLNYLDKGHELSVVLGKVPELKNAKDKVMVKSMIQLADLTRQGFINEDISNLMSPRTVITWAQNYMIFQDIKHSFRLTFLNKCDESERPIVAEYFQRCFGEELTESHSPES
jgi:cobaltochelatase CobS